MRNLRWAGFLGALAVLLTAPGCCAGQRAEEKTAQYMESVRRQPGLLLAFLQQMPKGGDLHVHLSGAVYAESMIDWAAGSGLCVERGSAQLVHGPCDACNAKSNAAKSNPAVSCALQDQDLYNQLVDAWSMRNWHAAKESGHDHFFATFGKFGSALDNHTGDALAELASRAAADHLQYVETMNTTDGELAGEEQVKNLPKKMGWEAKSELKSDDDFRRLREKLLAGMAGIVAAVRKQVDSDEIREREVMHCGTAQAAAGCRVTIRYLYQVGRGRPPEQVFAQIMLGFELTKADPRFVGFNLVMPEDYYVPMHDFDLHMRIIETLRKSYPPTHVSLHAGELAMGLVPPEGLRFHISESMERAGAERIGHGVDVMSEDDPIGLLREMAAKNVLVEICLTSNDVILGVSGDRHPLPVYMKYGVPVALATDDEGVSRGDMTHEYLRAVESYGLSYAELKRMARQSLEHSFIPGDSLWSDGRELGLTAACSEDKASDEASSDRVSPKCQKLIGGSERARLQWQLEQAFAEFEQKF